MEVLQALPGSSPHREAEQLQQQKGTPQGTYNKLKGEITKGPVVHI